MTQTEGKDSGPPAEEREPDLRQYLGILRARKWTIIAVVLVVFTLAAIRTFRTTPIYRASARLLIERTLPEVSPFEGLQERRDEKYFATQTNLITSKAVLQKALEDERLAGLFEEEAPALETERPGLLAAAWREFRAVFTTRPSRSKEPWERLRETISIQPLSATNLVDVEVSGPDPQRNSHIANSVCGAYVDYTVAMRRQSAVGTFQMLQQQRIEQQAALTGSEDALLAYREEAQLPDLDTDGGGGEAKSRLQVLKERLTQVQLDRMELGVGADALQSAVEDSTNPGSLLGLVSVREDQALAKTLDSLRERCSRTRLERMELEATATVLRETAEAREEWGPLLALTAVREDPLIAELRSRLMQVQLSRQLKAQKYGEKHPHMVTLGHQEELLRSRLKHALDRLARSIEAERHMLQEQEASQRNHLLARSREGVAGIARALHARREMLLSQEKEIVQNLEEAKRQALERARESHQYARLKRDMDRQARVFDVIVDRMREVDLTKDVGVTNVSVVQQASPPRMPVKPKVKRSLMLGLILGLILGTALAFELEHLDNTVKTPEDVEKHVQVPWLGYVPQIKVNGAGVGELPERATHSLRFPSSPATESFRSVRTNVYFSGERGEMKSLLVTSPQPGEGKTVFAANLAITMAQDGKRVLLVDADLRRPRMRSVFGLEKGGGLTDLLVKDLSLEEVVHTPPEGLNGELDNLHILTAGTRVPNPAELLGGTAMTRLARQARESYDMVIYDSCPAMFVADAAPLAGGADGVILVLKAGSTRREEAARACKQLKAVKATIIGGVLNGLRPSLLRGYAYRGYGYYYYDYEHYRSYSDQGQDVS